jgi:uncharacterized protein YceH (UPF0502 family)
MHDVLSPIEARVIGCLLEKAVVTPDQYPLTLNALTNACNQKSSRHPVMTLSQGEVLNALRSLESKHLVRSEENFKTQVEKFTHRFCNTPFSDCQFDEAQYAIVCVLLLRGPRTPGELRANSGRLHHFSTNEDVVEALTSLCELPQPVVVKLAKTPGRRDAEYAHLFSGPVEGVAPARDRVRDTSSAAVAAPNRSHSPESPAPQAPSLEERVALLEQQVAALTRRLGVEDGKVDEL